MTRGDSPKRLRAAGSSDLERRVLEAAAREKPPTEVRDHMALALGVSVSDVGGASAGSAPTGGAAASKTAAAGTSSTSLVPWLSAGVLGLVVAGAILGPRVWQASVRKSPPPAALVPVFPPAAPAGPTEPAPAAAGGPRSRANGLVEPGPGVTAARPGRHHRVATGVANLGGQTSLVDDARVAVSSGAPDRALELLRMYHEKYPGGIFRPEALALKIEALAKLGRTAEARALAEGFVDEYGAGPLTDRVSGIAGLPRR